MAPENRAFKAIAPKTANNNADSAVESPLVNATKTAIDKARKERVNRINAIKKAHNDRVKALKEHIGQHYKSIQARDAAIKKAQLKRLHMLITEKAKIERDMMRVSKQTRTMLERKVALFKRLASTSMSITQQQVARFPNEARWAAVNEARRAA